MKNSKNRVVKRFHKSRSRVLNKPKKLTESHLGKINKKINKRKRFSKIKRKNKRPEIKFKGINSINIPRVIISKEHPDSDYKVFSTQSKKFKGHKFSNIKNNKVIDKKKKLLLNSNHYNKFRKNIYKPNNTQN